MDHLREFATVKAIGGSNRDIYRIIAEQALIIGTGPRGSGNSFVGQAVTGVLLEGDLRLLFD
jgi:hypothetical protein